MTTADKLKKYVTAIADAIRAKEGSTESINPQDFTYRIENLQVGGGMPTPPSGGSNWRYFDFSNITLTGVPSYAFKSILAMIGKFDIDGAKIIAPPSTYIIEGGREFMANCIAGGIETSAKCNGEGELMDWNSYLEALGLNDSGLADMGITEITEEQFYTLD